MSNSMGINQKREIMKVAELKTEKQTDDQALKL
jgi:hypothetical protein